MGTAFPDLDQLYERYSADKSPDHLDDLLIGVRTTVVNRFRKAHPSDAEDIAQQCALRVWRSLEGMGLKPFDPTRGKFNPFVSTVAQSARSDFFKYDHFVLVDDRTLAALVHAQ